MNKGVTGMGSASLVLIFSTLCLTIFALISLMASRTDKSIADAGVRFAKEYYAADTLAECVLAELLAADTIPDSIRGISIGTQNDPASGAEVASYFCPISDHKALHVEVALLEDHYDILTWRMIDTGIWQINENLLVLPDPEF